MSVANRSLVVVVALASCLGCGGKSAANLKSLRETASEAYADGLKTFAAHDYATAEQKFSIALGGGLDADQFCIATTKRAVCWAAAGKVDEALAELDRLGSNVSNPDEVEAARAFVFKKQGKIAQANAAMAKARRYNRTIKEFQ